MVCSISIYLLLILTEKITPSQTPKETTEDHPNQSPKEVIEDRPNQLPKKTTKDRPNLINRKQLAFKVRQLLPAL